MSGEKLGMSYKYYPTSMYYTENAYPEALSLIVESVSSEREDELFYDYLLSVAPSRDQKDIIRSIRDDERKHNLMFREIYYQLTGQDIPVDQDAAFQPPGSYLVGIVRALFGELAAVMKYRRILFGMDFLPFRNMVTEIYTDELRHASMWNYLFTLNYEGAPVPATVSPQTGTEL
ncbi:MAG: ferritin-like domain-containing protein [Actinobacteria bacterium]|nr:ferritin-like domain-containing protein [Actinomycetota bacterium]